MRFNSVFYLLCNMHISYTVDQSFFHDWVWVCVCVCFFVCVSSINRVLWVSPITSPSSLLLFVLCDEPENGTGLSVQHSCAQQIVSRCIRTRFLVHLLCTPPSSSLDSSLCLLLSFVFVVSECFVGGRMFHLSLSLLFPFHCPLFSISPLQRLFLVLC